MGAQCCTNNSADFDVQLGLGWLGSGLPQATEIQLEKLLHCKTSSFT